MKVGLMKSPRLNRHHWVVVAFLMWVQILSACTASDDDIVLVASAQVSLDRAVEYLLSVQDTDGYWMGDLVTDTSFTADYILLMHYLERVNEQRQEKAVRYILDQQQADGGWAAYPDGPSVLYITVLDYLALKLAGIPAHDPGMIKAREFVLANGGAESTNTLVKTKLAWFGQVPWRSMIAINTNFMALGEIVYSIGYFHSVVIPQMLIFENFHVVSPPEGRDIQELFIDDPWEGATDTPPEKGCCADQVVEWILERQEVDGNWAGVFVNSMFSLIALKSTGDPAFDVVIEAGLTGVELFQNEDSETINQQFSQPPVMDTAYVLHALLPAGVASDHPAVTKAVEWLVGKQTNIYGDWHVLNPDGEPGGWSFEHENQYYPDVDCTAMVLNAFAQLDEASRERIADSIEKGIAWIISMQNQDDGWAAWDKDAVDPLTVLPKLEGELWVPKDVTWNDITARVVLTLSNLGYPGEDGDPTVIPGAIDLLKNRQEVSPGYWFGRWGTNYTYGTGQILQALVAAEEDPYQEYIQRAVEWLISVQNKDGGWGEDNGSYLDPSYAGVGESTIFQSAYVLIGLISADAMGSDAVKKGIRYLIDRQKEDGSWYDEQFLGTNLPGYWYSRYDMHTVAKAAYVLALFLQQWK